MNDLRIDVIDPKDTELIAHLHNTMFRPERAPDSFQRRFQGRAKILCLVASVKNDAVGFYIGFELKPSVHFGWLVGVAADARRMGIAGRLMHKAQRWARDEGYISLRFECNNTHRPMLHFGISENYSIVGIRWDPDTAQNIIIFERLLDNLTDE